MKKVYIIMVNYNGFIDTLECLESLKYLNYDNYQILIVDNDSSDDSVNKISSYGESIIYTKEEATSGGIKTKKSSFTNPLILIDAKENNGFAAGNNIALKYALAKNDFEYIWLLNNDTVVDSNALKELILGIERYDNAGAVGSKILYYDNQNILQNVGSKRDEKTFFKLCKPILNLNTENIDEGQFDYDFEVNDIMGASLLIRKNVIEEVGLMPEEYFLYGEETDWNFNIQKHGYKLMTIFKSKIYHKKSRTTGGDLSPISLYYRTRNQFFLNKKYMDKYKYIIYIQVYILKKIIFLGKYNFQNKIIIIKALLDGLINKKFRRNL